MPTNILAIPTRLDVPIVTFTNGSWLDSFPFEQAGAAAAYAAPTNAGNGAVTISSVAPQSALGASVIEVVEARVDEPARYIVRAPDGALMAIGRVGATIAAGGVILSLGAGSKPYSVGDSYTLGVTPTPTDITGIAFDLMLRTSAVSSTVWLSASTNAGTIRNGGATGQASLVVPRSIMQALPAGTYRYDLVASADGYDIVAYAGLVTHSQGVTART